MSIMVARLLFQFVFLFLLSEVGGSETNWESVSIRSHARTRAESGSEVGIGTNSAARPLSLFPFGSGRYFVLAFVWF